MNTTPPLKHGKCREVMRQINEYIDGDIDEELCEEIERHIDKCPDCKLIVDTISGTIKLYRTLAQAEAHAEFGLPPDVEQRLMARLNLPI